MSNDTATSVVMWLLACVVFAGGLVLLVAMMLLYGIGQLLLGVGGAFLTLAGYDDQARSLARTRRQIARVERDTIARLMRASREE